MAGSVSFLVLSAVLGISSLYTTQSLGSELSQTASVASRSMELAGAAATDAANMLSAERGLLLRLALGDQANAVTLHDSFAKSAKTMREHLAQLQLLTTTPEGKAANQRIESAMASWIPADDEMWQLCSKQDYQSAFKVFDDKVSPQAGPRSERRTAILDIEHQYIETAKVRAVELPSRSRFVAIGLLAVSLVVGGSGGLGFARRYRHLTCNVASHVRNRRPGHSGIRTDLVAQPTACERRGRAGGISRRNLRVQHRNQFHDAAQRRECSGRRRSRH